MSLKSIALSAVRYLYPVCSVLRFVPRVCGSHRECPLELSACAACWRLYSQKLRPSGFLIKYAFSLVTTVLYCAVLGHTGHCAASVASVPHLEHSYHHQMSSASIAAYRQRSEAHGCHALRVFSTTVSRTHQEPCATFHPYHAQFLAGFAYVLCDSLRDDVSITHSWGPCVTPDSIRPSVRHASLPDSIKPSVRHWRTGELDRDAVTSPVTPSDLWL